MFIGGSLRIQFLRSGYRWFFRPAWTGINFTMVSSMLNVYKICGRLDPWNMSLIGSFKQISLCIQFGAYLPFFREHSDLDSPKREPYVYLQNNSFAGPFIKEALQDRQILLPFWYTLFYQHSVDGQPVIRPLVMEFPNEVETFDMDHEFLLGTNCATHCLLSVTVNIV